MTQGEVMGYLGGTYDSNTKGKSQEWVGHGCGHKVSLHNTVLEVLQAFPCVCEAHQSAKWEQEVGYYGDRSKVAMGIECLVQQTFGVG